MTDQNQLRYPIGKFERPQMPLDAATRSSLIGELDRAPALLRAAVEGLSDSQLDTPYREGGWTIRQVVHHVPDSHMNGYVRMKLAATENEPAIKLYKEALWAELTDARSAPIAMSLDLLDALHRRWTTFLRALADGDFHKTFMHPEWGSVPLDMAVALYAWHGRHHLGHIRTALARA